VLAALRDRSAARRRAEPIVLARSLERTVADAWRRPRPAWSAATVVGDACSRRAVRDASAELCSLARALRESALADPEPLRLCRGLLRDGFSSPLYGADAEALRREAGRLRFCVLARAADG
jgi:hypothetical protein